MLFNLTPLRLAWLIAALGGAAAAFAAGSPHLPVTSSEQIAALVLVLWSGIEMMVRRDWPSLIVWPALLLGIGCALPLYLFMRSRPVV